MEFSNKSLKDDLIRLWKIQNDIQETASARGIEATEGDLGKLLDKAQEFIARYGPQQFTISLGGTAGAGMSFTWEGKRKPVPRFVADV